MVPVRLVANRARAWRGGEAVGHIQRSSYHLVDLRVAELVRQLAEALPLPSAREAVAAPGRGQDAVS